MSNSIPSVKSSPWPPVAKGLTPRQQLGSFEVNAREFGPVAASDTVSAAVPAAAVGDVANSPGNCAALGMVAGAALMHKVA